MKILVILSIFFYHSVTYAETGVFSGGDDGEGLDFIGNFVYAINVRGDGGEVVGDATFTNDSVTGVTLSAQNNITSWHNANYGDTSNDNALESVMKSIRWSYRGTDVLTANLANLVVGQTYSLQLLFAESCCNRGFDISVEGTQIVDNFAPYVLQGGTRVTNLGAFVRYEFVATDTTLNIAFGGSAPAYSDNNPILHALTLELISESVIAPIADYRFDELIWNGAPNEVIDNSGNNYDGTAIGEITTTTGKVCNAANIPKNTSATSFQAVNSGIDLDNVVGSSGTISLWYKGNSAWNSGDDKRLFDATDGDKYFMAEIGSDGRVKFWFEDVRISLDY